MKLDAPTVSHLQTWAGREEWLSDAITAAPLAGWSLDPMSR